MLESWIYDKTNSLTERVSILLGLSSVSVKVSQISLIIRIEVEVTTEDHHLMGGYHLLRPCYFYLFLYCEDSLSELISRKFGLV